MPWRFTCNRRAKVHEKTPITIEATSRAKCVAEEVKLNVLVLLLSLNVLAIDNRCLLRMKFQAAFSEPLRETCLHELRLFERATVDQTIIGVSTVGATLNSGSTSALLGIFRRAVLHLQHCLHATASLTNTENALLALGAQPSLITPASRRMSDSMSGSLRARRNAPSGRSVMIRALPASDRARETGENFRRESCETCAQDVPDGTK